ncbi:MAG TPA: acetoacetate--CoA ligase, partial [Marinobacter sp.]|nr:acetoacetate--CoA ligase [Marinobacter sp.]
EVVLLVVPADGQTVTTELSKTLKSRIREGASPRHVPKHIVQVPDIPYTRSGKKVELAVARLINGSKKADNRDALGNPEALDQIRDRLQEEGLLPATI